METIIETLKAMCQQVSDLIARLNIADKENRVQTLEERSAAPDFWNDPESAQKVMQEIARLREEMQRWRTLEGRVNDTLELALIDDPDLMEDLTSEVKTLEQLMARMELQAVFTGPYDSSDAILAIHAGAGGTEAQDWAQMLERMYLRWAEENNYKLEIIERMEGEEAGIKSVTIGIRGEYAYGYLQSEQGVHRLVRISPFDAAKRRHTSFAKVELWPDIQDDIDIEVNERDLRIDTYRSSGAGGQNVQKNDTAIRITHIPTGIVVQCQNQRSQVQNRERAMQILKARLFEIERKKRDAQLAELKGENVDAGWGNQIRSYVLHPYQMVKDHRTDYETGNTGAVLDGRINDFMDSYLRARIRGMSPVASS